MKTNQKTFSTSALRLEFEEAKGKVEAITKEPLSIDFEEFYELVTRGTFTLHHMRHKTVNHIRLYKSHRGDDTIELEACDLGRLGRLP